MAVFSGPTKPITIVLTEWIIQQIGVIPGREDVEVIRVNDVGFEKEKAYNLVLENYMEKQRKLRFLDFVEHAKTLGYTLEVFQDYWMQEINGP